MADSAWAEITIGGNLIAEKVEDLRKILSYECECLLEDSEDINDHLHQGTLYFEHSDAADGEFKELEKFCDENNLSYIRRSSAISEYDACIVWHTPNGNRYNILDSNDKEVVRAYNIKEIIKALENIPTTEEAPLHINRKDETGILSKYLLEHGGVDPIAYMKKRIEDLCPTVPDLPDFKIIS